jgi:hypothetical protein
MIILSRGDDGLSVAAEILLRLLVEQESPSGIEKVNFDDSPTNVRIVKF